MDHNTKWTLFCESYRERKTDGPCDEEDCTRYLTYVYGVLWMDYISNEDRNLRRTYALPNVIENNWVNKSVLAQRERSANIWRIGTTDVWNILLTVERKLVGVQHVHRRAGIWLPIKNCVVSSVKTNIGRKSAPKGKPLRIRCPIYSGMMKQDLQVPEWGELAQSVVEFAS